MDNASAIAAGLAGPGRAAIHYLDLFNAERPLTLQCYRPQGYRPEDPVVIVQHGMLRNGDDYRDFWIPAAERHGLLIVAPTFPAEHWPEAGSYNNGRVIDETGGTRRRADWGYAIIARICDDLRAAAVTTRPRMHLFGHSAGGQFVHRLLGIEGDAPFEAVIAGNSGWYTLPSLALPFPEGMGGLGLGDGDLERLLAGPLLILAGDRDIVTDDPNLPRNPEAVRQGPHRFARAHNYLDAGRREAERRGVPFGWRLQPVPGIGHDGAAMSVVAASLWFAGGMPSAAELEALAGRRVA